MTFHDRCARPRTFVRPYTGIWGCAGHNEYGKETVTVASSIRVACDTLNGPAEHWLCFGARWNPVYEPLAKGQTLSSPHGKHIVAAVLQGECGTLRRALGPQRSPVAVRMRGDSRIAARKSRTRWNSVTAHYRNDVEPSYHACHTQLAKNGGGVRSLTLRRSDPLVRCATLTATSFRLPPVARRMKQRTRRMLALASLLGVLLTSYLHAQMQAAERAWLARPEPRRAFSISEPTSDRPVSGTCRLAVSFSDKSIASVEYLLGSKRLGIAVKPPFELDWNTAYGADGSSAVQAIARDSFGNPVTAAERIFTLNNYGNFMTATAPDLTRSLHGIVTMTVSGKDSRYYPAEWLAYLDGEQMAVGWTDNTGKHAVEVAMRLDTTRFTNGKHELYAAMHSDYWQPGHQEEKFFYSWRAGFERVVNIDNGHALMDIAANYLHVYLQPGRHTTLTCRRLFTDNTSGPCSAPTFSTSDMTVAAVSQAGVVTAGPRPGFATITLADGGKTTLVRVWVTRISGVPHFSGNGQMLNSYRAGASLFVVSPFVLQPEDLKKNPDLAREAKRAGVNTLSRGFYLNPRNLRADYNSWRTSYDNNVRPDWQFARNNGFHILATGDEVARGIGAEAWWTLNWPAGKRAVQYAMCKLATTGVAISVEMVDEASMMWGGTPKPPGRVGAQGSFRSISCSGKACTVSWPHNPVTPARFPSGVNFALAHSVNRNLNTSLGHMFTATNIRPDSFDFTPTGPVEGTFTAANDRNLEFVWWAGSIGGCPAHPCIPPVPNSALTEITNWIKTAPSSTPISWPVLGIAPAVVQGNWMGSGGISDYASHYWDSFNPRRTYPWSGGIEEFNYWMRSLFYDRQPLMMLDRPQLFLDSISSFMYTKKTSKGAYYAPPADSLEQPGLAGPAITSTIMSAAALGGAGVRLYQFEAPSNLASRIKAPPGTILQTGANPTASDPIVRDNWRAMAFAANPLTKTLMPYVLGTALASPAYGRNIVTAARQGPGARLLMVINGNDWPRTVPVDFTRYRTGQAISCYRIGYDGIATSVVSDRPGQLTRLAAGESMVFLFPTASTGRFVRAVKIAPPGGPGKAVLHYNYIYKEALHQTLTGVDCTDGCTLHLDRGLGSVYYEFTHLGSGNRVIGNSSVLTLSGSS
jgi:hypothetical protein